MYKTPLFVDTSVDSFKTYISSLSKHARKDYAYVVKHNQDLVFEPVEYRRELVEGFMGLWELQTIHGSEKPKWAFTVDHVDKLDEKGVLRVFQARKGDVIMAVQFCEVYGDYMECHPPMYDKKYNSRYLAKYMWFHLVEWAIGSDVMYVDLGGGHRGTWRELVSNRKEHPRIGYKWMYVADSVKKNPHKEKDYLVYHQHGDKWISEVN